MPCRDTIHVPCQCLVIIITHIRTSKISPVVSMLTKIPTCPSFLSNQANFALLLLKQLPTSVTQTLFTPREARAFAYLVPVAIGWPQHLSIPWMPSGAPHLPNLNVRLPYWPKRFGGSHRWVAHLWGFKSPRQSVSIKLCRCLVNLLPNFVCCGIGLDVSKHSTYRSPGPLFAHAHCHARPPY